VVQLWKEALAGAPPLLELPTDRPRPRLQTFVGSAQVLTIEPDDRARALRGLREGSAACLGAAALYGAMV
jgi:hypothetical protein